jgi:hypothetical protein
MCRMWTGFIWLRVGISDVLLWTREWTFEFHERRDGSWLAEPTIPLLKRAQVHGVVVDHVDGVRQRLWTAATTMPVVHPPGDVWVRRATVDLYRQGKTEELRAKPAPMSLCPTHFWHELTRARTRASAVGCWQITASPMARHKYTV